ncbi:MAG: DUF4263 domain-containing protein [Holophagales bacterium]|nr:DUF4263 domain-containing protein [Holophagales bacterium]
MAPRSSFDPTYLMASNAPPPLGWQDYADGLLVEWHALLSTTPPEREIHRFLERHPSMVPGAFTTAGVSESGHFPEPPGLITEPPLSGLTRRVPDFLWIAVDSATISPVLIELERPEKRWFTAAGTPSADFTQAQHQLAEWRSWMADPTHQLLFREFFGLHDDYWRRHAFRPIYILIYGRRDEFLERDDLNRLRRELERPDEFYMTFDRLAPQRNAAEFVCLRIGLPRQYQVVTWPPVATFSPLLAERRSHFLGLAEAIAASERLSAERRQFLAERLPYWTAWVKDPQSRRGIVHTADRE